MQRLEDKQPIIPAPAHVIYSPNEIAGARKILNGLLKKTEKFKVSSVVPIVEEIDER